MDDVFIRLEISTLTIDPGVTSDPRYSLAARDTRARNRCQDRRELYFQRTATFARSWIFALLETVNPVTVLSRTVRPVYALLRRAAITPDTRSGFTVFQSIFRIGY